jgi:hypothetical protein
MFSCNNNDKIILSTIEYQDLINKKIENENIISLRVFIRQPTSTGDVMNPPFIEILGL